MRNLKVWLFYLIQLAAVVIAGAGNWTKPNGLSPSFTDTYTVGERIFVSWLSLNDSINDLWLTRYNTSVDTYAFRLEVARNVSYPGSYEWTIGVNTTEIAIDTRFIFQFLPTGAAYDPNQPPRLPSPAFNLITVNQQNLPNGTVGAPSVMPSATSAASTQTTIAPTSATSSIPSDTPPPEYASAGLGRSVAIGVSIAAVVLAVSSMVGAFFVIRIYKRPKPVEQEVDDEFKASGPYEILGSSKQPTELTSKETMVYEMNSPTSTLHGSSSSVYELSTTTKKPGLHELP